MLPSFSLDHFRDRHSAYAEVVSDSVERSATSASGANCHDFLGVQTSCTIGLAFGSTPSVAGSPLSRHVGGVVGASARPQVGGIAARRIVAAVEGALTGGEKAVGHLIGHAMSEARAARTGGRADAVSLLIRGSKPRPTGIRTAAAVNLLPKARGEWGRVSGHRSLLLRCRAGGVCRTARHLFCLPTFYQFLASFGAFLPTEAL